MAKSARASSRKANNQRLKANVFGPVEAARQARLSAKLQEIVNQSKPVPEREMKDTVDEAEAESEKAKSGAEQKDSDTAMEIDSSAKTQPKTRRSKITKRRGRKSNIVFPKFGDRKTIKKRR